MEYQNSTGDRLGPRLATIIRCDLGKMFELNLDSSQYVSAPYPPKPLTKQQTHAEGLDRQMVSWSEKPMLRIETTTVDTGQRKQLFGHTARHVITTRKQIPLQGSNSQAQESVRDGWYIDLNQQISCDPDYMSKGQRYWDAYLVVVTPTQGSATQTMDRPEFVNVGKPETGFALQEVATSDTTFRAADGTMKHATSKDETVVTEFHEGSLDPAIFEVPHGFKRVKEIERNAPSTPLNPIVALWERVKYTFTSWFSLD
jgi:hypothetical protein